MPLAAWAKHLHCLRLYSQASVLLLMPLAISLDHLLVAVIVDLDSPHGRYPPPPPAPCSKYGAT